MPSRTAEPPRVVVTGAGLITPLGNGWRVNADGFRLGRTAFRPVTLFEVSRQRAKRAAEVDVPSEAPPTRLSARHWARLERAGRMLLMAASEAWQQSGWTPAEDLPVILGTTGGGMALGEDYYRQAIRSPGIQCRQATRVAFYQPQRQGLDLGEAFGFRGPVTMIANACASGANAIGHAWELIRSGRAERVLTGGYDSLCQTIFAGFDSLQALSPTQTRPFDAQRDGLALGEGAAMLTLESLDSARRRGAEILGEIAGYGAVTDIHHLTQPHPDGAAALAAMQAASAAAGVTPDDVDYVNAHGTGTALNDGAEAAAINRWAARRVSTLPVSSTKASIGHLLGAAGAVEAVVCLMTLREQWLPPELALETLDPLCQFPVVREPTDTRVDVVVTNSFGFGGANASLILRRWR
ncbi:MAG: beta-ketoacyl-[acyl-carrier-protein] synthase family protein [Limisphaerales bacterium]